MGRGTIRIMHLADIHLGFTGPTNLVLSEAENAKMAGRYVREVDIENAVSKMTMAIINEQQPPVDMVLIAGDLFHKPTPSPHALSHAARMIQQLVMHDIAVVIIDGNHETSNLVHTGSPTTILQFLGAQIVNDADYQILHDWSALSPEKQKKLEKLAVHALPYRALRDQSLLAGVVPLPESINVLLAHGRVAGMDELNSLHHTAYTIPTEILRRGWDYVALGDWHIHRYQPLKDIPAFYAGALEALTFGEAALYPPYDDDKYALHGALDVRLSLDQQPEVQTFEHKDTRPVLRLEAIDATDCDTKSLLEMLHMRLQAGLPAHALVLLEVKNVLPHIWQQMDHAEIARLRNRVRRCEVRPDFQRVSPSQNEQALSEASLDTQWEHFIGQRVRDTTERTWYEKEGMKRIEDARQVLQAAYAQEGE